MLPVITGVAALVGDVERATGSAALARADCLPEGPNAAVAVAVDYTARNGFTIDESDVSECET